MPKPPRHRRRQNHRNNHQPNQILESNLTSPSSDAPSTFRIPISLVRRSAESRTSPNNPKQAIRIANPANDNKNFPVRCSPT